MDSVSYINLLCLFWGFSIVFLILCEWKEGFFFFNFIYIFFGCVCADKVLDAVEVAGRNVMSTSSSVTTELVSHK